MKCIPCRRFLAKPVSCRCLAPEPQQKYDFEKGDLRFCSANPICVEVWRRNLDMDWILSGGGEGGTGPGGGGGGTGPGGGKGDGTGLTLEPPRAETDPSSGTGYGTGTGPGGGTAFVPESPPAPEPASVTNLAPSLELARWRTWSLASEPTPVTEPPWAPELTSSPEPTGV